ncbi:pro neuregulin 2 membrane bound [Echinococcus multilocularis]|uniref:Pro neuregulin 2 membrane bound n=1 Tax=Echinococcus multilocularis TaxID=6211 RepID=A0A068Y9E3_ECHMU|nr:pro neuregulin 2 membrane bound [Echinococcus multilocularis]
MTSFKGPPLSWMLLHFLLLLLSLHTPPTHGTTESWHYEVPFFLPPDPSRPCRHAFRDDPETSALLADFVVIGHPTPTYRHSPGVLYNASVLVEQVLKRPRLSIYPVREGFPILTGPFSQWTDLGRCWINVHTSRKYIFFIDRPNWAGFFRISHLPLIYTNQRWQKIQTILKYPPSPLQMRSLHHQESLKVQQGEEVVLSCVVMGRPAPLISWYVNNTQQLGLWNVATGRGVIHKNKRKSRLQISNTHPMDSGNYSCLAENVNGYIKKTVEIYVVPRPQTTPQPWTTLPPLTGRPRNSPLSANPQQVVFIHAIATAYTGTATSSMADRHADADVDMWVDVVSCISQYYGTRCEFNEKAPEETKAIQSECSTGCDNFIGRLVLFSTLGALFSLLLLVVICLFVKRKTRSSSSRNLLRVGETPTQPPIPMNFLVPSDRGPESLSRVCTPLGHPHSHFDSLTALPWKGDTNCANVTTIVSAPTADDNPYILTSALPLHQH